jgi:hypothetical protein
VWWGARGKFEKPATIFSRSLKKIVAGYLNREGRHGHVSGLEAVADEFARIMSGCV